MTLPALFISHGSPMLALEPEPTTHFLQQLPEHFARPRAIIVASAHWETAEPEITATMQPDTIHDFYGFPKALYALRYPAPGDPVLAKRVQSLLNAAGFNASKNATRGIDHGAWNPLLLMYPAADIPVIQLSVQPQHDALWHYQLGQALAPLRDDGILVIGSGNLTHNLREAFRGQHATTPEWVTAFEEWVAACVESGNTEALLSWHTQAPFARENHPTPEHFLPFFVALGAGGQPLVATRMNPVVSMGVLAMDAYGFGQNKTL